MTDLEKLYHNLQEASTLSFKLFRILSPEEWLVFVPEDLADDAAVWQAVRRVEGIVHLGVILRGMSNIMPYEA